MGCFTVFIWMRVRWQWAQSNGKERQNGDRGSSNHFERQFIPPSWWWRSSPCHKSYLYLVWPFVSASNHSSLPCGPCISEEEEVKCVLCLSCQFWSSDSHIHLLNFCHSQYPNLMTRLPHLIIPQFMYTAVQPIPLASWPVLSDTCYFLWPANIAQIDLLYIPWQITHMAILGFYLSACTRKNFLYMQMLVLKPC